MPVVGQPLIKKEKKGNDRKIHLHLKEGNTQMKWLTVSKRAQPAQLHRDGKKLSEVRFTILSFTVWYLVLFVCLLCASVKSKQMCPPCSDGDAFSGSSPDSTADGASLRHPGAQAGAE